MKPLAEKGKIFMEGYGKGTGYGLYLIRKMCEVYGWTRALTPRDATLPPAYTMKNINMYQDPIAVILFMSWPDTICIVSDPPSG